MRVVWLFSLWHKKKRFRNLHQLKKYNYSQLEALRCGVTLQSVTQEKRFRNLHQLKNCNYSQLQALRATLTSFFKIFHFSNIIYYDIYLLVDLPGCFYTFINCR